MSDKIGVLGKATATVVATATIYTCPVSKAAKGRFFVRFQGDTNTVVARNTVMTINHYNYTIKGGGMFAYAAGAAAAPTGLANALTAAPSDAIYYLSAGDTVQYTVVTAALLAANFQFVGVEIDV